MIHLLFPPKSFIQNKLTRHGPIPYFLSTFEELQGPSFLLSKNKNEHRL